MPSLWLYLEADHGYIWRLAISPPWLYLEAGHISTLAIPGGWPYLLTGYTCRLAISPPWLYLDAGHISSLTVPGGWQYLLPDYTWRLAISPPWLESTLTPHLAAISSWAYSYVIGGYFFLSKNRELRIFLLLSLRFFVVLGMVKSLPMPDSLGF
jgi:hypothetical protein